MSFLVQTRLVAARKLPLHRKLGYAATGLVLLILVIGHHTAIEAARHGYDLDRTNDPLGLLIFPLGDLLAFAVLVTAGVAYRRRAAIHKRLMLFATIGAMMNAPLAHLISETPALFALPGIILPFQLLLLGASAVYDELSLGRVHPVSVWVGLGLFGWVLSAQS